MGMKVGDAMTFHAVTVAPEQDLFLAFNLMQRSGFRHLPVVEKGELVGMLSDRDILLRGTKINDVVMVGDRRIADAMSKDVRTCRPGDRLGDAIDILLRQRIDALPVVDDNGHVVGIVTTTDALAMLRRREGVTDPEAQIDRE